MPLFHKSLGQGPPLVILHGLFGSLDNWMGIAKALSAQQTVYLVDLRNHGKSFHDRQFNYSVMSEDLLQWSRQVGLKDYALLGHSMGGKVAMFHAQQYPEKLHRLLIVDIGPKAYPVHHQAILDGLSAIDTSSLQSRQEADDSLALFVPEAGVRQFLLKNLKREEGGGFRWKLNLPVIRDNIQAVGTALPVEPQVTVPGLFLTGEKSHYVLDSDRAAILQQFPNAEIRSVAGAGHWIHAEAPTAFVKEVGNYLQAPQE